VNSTTAGQNIGYATSMPTALREHQLLPRRNACSTGGPGRPRHPIEAHDRGAGASDDVRSYNLVRILHLVGDTHQLPAGSEAWVKESAELAKQFADAPPVITGTNAVLLTREYETNARNSPQPGGARGSRVWRTRSTVR
jgi:hypothetical protein